MPACNNNTRKTDVTNLMLYIEFIVWEPLTGVPGEVWMQFVVSKLLSRPLPVGAQEQLFEFSVIDCILGFQDTFKCLLASIFLRISGAVGDTTAR